MILPAAIPIFPLPNVVLFPNVFLPLHIFEPRYRAMVRDALESDRIIGMVLLQAGHVADDHGRPPVHQVGCAGLITHAEPLPDGRSNIVLRGLEKFRILGEEDGQPYRIARVEPLQEPLTPADRAAMAGHRQRLEALLAAARQTGAQNQSFASVPDGDLVNALAQYLSLEPIERQALLEQDGVVPRCHALIELLEMKTLLTDPAAWSGGPVH